MSAETVETPRNGGGIDDGAGLVRGTWQRLPDGICPEGIARFHSVGVTGQHVVCEGDLHGGSIRHPDCANISKTRLRAGLVDYTSTPWKQRDFIRVVVEETGTPPPPPPPPSSFPSNPMNNVVQNNRFTLMEGTIADHVYVPGGYDTTHNTPMTLFVWMHGCGGNSEGGIWNVSNASQNYITLAPGGAEGGCWNMATDVARIRAAIANLKTRFNIKPKGVILGGYSSGGDLAYRSAFQYANEFAGILVADTSPYRDTGLTQAASLAAVSWKFNVVHLAHLQDTVYPISGVRAETASMQIAGYPITILERTGNHYDPANANVNGQIVPGTDADIRTLLLPYLNSGWLAP